MFVGKNTDASTRNALSLVLDAAVLSVRNQLRWVSHTVAAFATLTHFVCRCGSLLAQAHPSLRSDLLSTGVFGWLRVGGICISEYPVKIITIDNDDLLLTAENPRARHRR